MSRLSLLILLLITPGLLLSGCYTAKYIYKDELIKNPSLTAKQEKTTYAIEKPNRSYTEKFSYLKIDGQQVVAKPLKSDNLQTFQLNEVKTVKKRSYNRPLTMGAAILGIIVALGLGLLILVGSQLEGWPED